MVLVPKGDTLLLEDDLDVIERKQTEALVPGGDRGFL